MNTTTTTPAPKVDPVIEALRSMRTEADRWNTADALLARIPAGLNGFDVIADEAAAAGLGEFKPNTLRLYRDTASRWAKADRLPNVSFSAHREAMVADGGTAGSIKILTDLVKVHGADKVTVASVRRAIAVQKGKPVVSGPASSRVRAVDVLADIKAGSPDLIAAITATDDLDALHVGLTKAIAHVERLRSKAAVKAKKAAAASKPVVANKPVAKANGAAKAPAKSAGDLRNL